jgi:hypothetical protein
MVVLTLAVGKCRDGFDLELREEFPQERAKMKPGNPSVRWKARKTNAEPANFGRRHARSRYRCAGALRSNGHGRFMRQRTPDVGFGQFSSAIMHHRVGGRA